ncbi:hypothetical protein BKA62DRAFT_774262 [Auriculariales sp. MPI-PUGE-AT-0066]|nr:hypothetical protein BKA62DRAFT_774262 [Auriculariales sp. MPI-PUGE-AT-0066]
MTSTGRRAELKTDEDAVCAILDQPPITMTVDSFIRRAKFVAEDYNIPWSKITSLPELKSTNLRTMTGKEATVDIINAISKRVQKLSGKWPLIHWGSFGPGFAPGGDFKKCKILPDYRASVVLNDSMTTATTPWQELVSTGEYESVGSSDSGQPQMLHYLLELLRYRPELGEGFAILRLKTGPLRFASANACSIFVTTDCAAGESADALIAYVVLVYDALHRRNSMIELIVRPAPTVSTPPPTPSTSTNVSTATDTSTSISTATDTSTNVSAAPPTAAPPTFTNPRYRLQPPPSIQSTSYVFDATIARHRPGRATFGGSSTDGKCFCKLSWQDKEDSHRSERVFYDAASAGGDKIPGLARMKKAWMYDTPALDNPYNPEKSHQQRCLEVTVLSCVGKDITFCENVRQSLMVMHDTIDVSRRLAFKHLMHRDFSAGNVLCDPVYEDGKQPTSLTCAEAVTGTQNPSPRCLVIDLDHAKLIEGGSTDPAKFEVTGTPLYMSSELLSRAEKLVWLKGLVPTVRGLLPHIPPILSVRFEQMFPDYKTFEKLQTALQGVLDQTAKLFEHEDYVKRGNLLPIHTPRHDLESIFWVFSIFFASALPKDLAKVPQEKFDNFMVAMHENDEREKRVLSVPDIEEVLHPQLEALAPLLHKISALLFYIPWCRLPVGPATLAHDLVRCMLLTFLYDDEHNSKILETELAMGVARKLHPPAPMFRSTTRPSKRKNGAGNQTSRPHKRIKVDGDRRTSELTAGNALDLAGEPVEDEGSAGE